jgi:signal transduction histidine kinase
MMFGDGSKRAQGGGLWYATLLFVLLLVLPSTYLGYGQWRSIQSERDEAIEDLPREVADSADRLVLAIRERFEELIEEENERPFWHFRSEYQPITSRGSDLSLIPSPLVDSPLPQGTRAHFAYTLDEGRDALVKLFLGSGLDPGMRDAVEQDLLQSAEQLVEYELNEDLLFAAETLMNFDWSEVLDRSLENLLTARRIRIPLPLAAVNLSKETDIDCLRENLPVLVGLQEHELTTLITNYEVRALLDERNTRRLVATRRVFIASTEGLTGALPVCFEEAAYGTTLVQGIFLDHEWLLEELPERMAATIIPAKVRYRLSEGPHSASRADVVETTRSLYEELGIEATNELHAAGNDKLFISSETSHIERLYSKRWTQFLGTVAVLTAALGTGLVLLLRSVRASIRETARTRNFVAAVSHELRTPVAALRLYGEMLSEGWAEDEEKRDEYHQRIVRESERLELLVDRVMRKTRLETTGVQLISTDLSTLVGEIVETLREGRNDIELAVDPEIPLSLTDPEGVRSILENLVDNSRKYAKSSPDDPVQVSLSVKDGIPYLAVSDRGPGVPEEERTRLFDAFYRSGDEERRSAKGIGLGLHLAALHANAMGAELEVLGRSGGGAVFSVQFRRASSR